MIIETSIRIRGLTICINVPREHHHGDVKVAAQIADGVARDMSYLMTHGAGASVLYDVKGAGIPNVEAL